MITTPDPDTYGQYARASLLADYVELLVVLNRQPVTRATVADFLADSGPSWDMELIRLPQQGPARMSNLAPCPRTSTKPAMGLPSYSSR